ncbi:hypothetical protein GE21DRAFT_9515 [Neurospora crassa]|uniref:Uncharacterized protein n=2 Tax=Neurospora crassa TaxID=5141 RepID=Q1K5P2_NEUCR|nr:hypothetical protein NCU05091 [Neurospora crassa OR74A]EAA27841.1 hypothetical protein NCU05091 [Neurospora crassa OR74A]KHE87961.1 hypothetical protein GE21DRAFT_9515 [Neurospora crassa]CAD70417.1 hypothetical protein [Neurospora crassa]|eukprot:XP_957077.1 hypothetical protein NCU05091 [Neurospora crassa OR74A]
MDKGQPPDHPASEQEPPAKRHKPLNSYFPQPFRGKIFVQNERPREEEAIAAAREAIASAKRSTENDFTIAFFTDASVEEKTPDLPGGYSVVFDNFFPGTHHYRERLGMAWLMPNMITSTIGEAVGILQALQVAIHHLRAIAISPADTASARRVTLCIFSDAHQVIRLIKCQNLNVGDIPGFDVFLELHWVKGHAGVEENDQADLIARRARPIEDGRDIFVASGADVDATALPPAVHLLFLDDIAAEKARQRPPRPLGKQNDRRKRNGKRAHRRRDENVPSSSLHTPNDDMTYSPPPWASDSFRFSTNSLEMPQYPATRPFSFASEEHPRVSEKPTLETEEQSPMPKQYTPLDVNNHEKKPAVEIEALERDSTLEQGVAVIQPAVIQQAIVEKEAAVLNINKPTIGLDSSANEQALTLLQHEEQEELMTDLEVQVPEKNSVLEHIVSDSLASVPQQVVEEDKHSVKREVQKPAILLSTGMEVAENKQDATPHSVNEQHEPSTKAEDQKFIIPEAIEDTEPSPDSEGSTAVHQPAEEHNDSALEPLLGDQALIDLQLEGEYVEWCQRRLQDVLVSVYNHEGGSTGETDTSEEVISGEETQAAVGRPLAEEVEATLA